LADEYDIKYFWHAVKDWKIWVNLLITIGYIVSPLPPSLPLCQLTLPGIYTPLYSISLFLPTIVRTLGYTNNMAQLMTVPPYVVACIVCIASGFMADRFKTRGVFLIGNNCITLMGLIMLITSHNPQVKYAGTFFLAAGAYTTSPQGVAWTGNNIGGSMKRGVGIAMQVGFG